MKAGITGLPYSGKTTLFCALTGQDYTKLSHGKDIHVGSVKVPDDRLDKLYEIFTPKKKTNAVMEYFDLAGQSADKEKGMEPSALQTMKNANALIGNAKNNNSKYCWYNSIPCDCHSGCGLRNDKFRSQLNGCYWTDSKCESGCRGDL